MCLNSFEARNDGVWEGLGQKGKLPSRWFPMIYAIEDSFIVTVPAAHSMDSHSRRGVMCTLRRSKKNTVRNRVRLYVERFLNQPRWASVREHSFVTFKGIGTRLYPGDEYKKRMASVSIIVTCSPANWAGDFRLMESLGSGALVFIDQRHTPVPHGLVNGVHLVEYNSSNRTDLYSRLEYYLQNPVKARKIARQGFEHAMRHFRIVPWIDYLVRTALDEMDLYGSNTLEEPGWKNGSNYGFEAVLRQKERVRHWRPRYLHTGRQILDAFYAKELGPEKKIECDFDKSTWLCCRDHSPRSQKLRDLCLGWEKNDWRHW